MGKTSTNIPENTAGLLSYVLGWVSGLIMFLLEPENRFVRFHAVQSMITFGALSVLWFIVWLPFRYTWFGFYNVFGSIFGIIAFILWVVLMVKAYQGAMYKLPVIGDLAERLLAKKS
jgi:uncharacterized membrane protein